MCRDAGASVERCVGFTAEKMVEQAAFGGLENGTIPLCWSCLDSVGISRSSKTSTRYAGRYEMAIFDLSMWNNRLLDNNMINF